MPHKMGSRLMRDLLCAAIVGVSGCAPGPHPLEGQPVPAVTLPVLDGGDLNVAELEGDNAIVLDFWATWCTPCRESLPALDRVAGEFIDEDVVVVAVNVAESDVAARGFVSEIGLELPVAMDRDGRAAVAFSVEAMPTTFYIDKTGTIRRVREGVSLTPEDEYRADIRDLLRE